MKFYAYIPTDTGKEPTGSDNRIIFELKTIKGAIKRAINSLGHTFQLHKYSNFYDDNTFQLIVDRKEMQT